MYFEKGFPTLKIMGHNKKTKPMDFSTCKVTSACSTFYNFQYIYGEVRPCTEKWFSLSYIFLHYKTSFYE